MFDADDIVLDGAPSGETSGGSAPLEAPNTTGEPRACICTHATGNPACPQHGMASVEAPRTLSPEGEALEALTELRKHFEDRGLCHILEKRGACDCPLCLIDRVRRALLGQPQEPSEEAIQAAAAALCATEEPDPMQADYSKLSSAHREWWRGRALLIVNAFWRAQFPPSPPKG